MKKPSISTELWNINKYLAYTGWRIYVQFSCGHEDAEGREEPTRIGLQYWGFRGVFDDLRQRVSRRTRNGHY